ncbi:peptidase S24 [Achromobacter sp. MYb9]|uniref:LexA family protein n=1 Tax=Achromobacter sp. MYb9 TaxID=1827284 RepID=UPI000CFBC136|nr:S24 family peptidase [Achromobacter sp. MYb9]PQZ67629.1 peptidase S24 [Achromobacter sp. MYb9]
MARTNNDAQHLRRLRDLYARAGCMPSYSEMARALGFKAKNAAFKLTQRLVASGYLEKSVGGRLVPSSDFFTVDFSDDEVRAGFGCEGNATGRLQAQALNQLLITRPSKTVFLQVRGDSMVDAGILSGDVAVVETGMQAVHGDVVVAEIDGIHTIKEYRIDRGKPYLAAHDQDRRSMCAKETLNIIGVVRGVVRSYKPSLTGRAKLAKQGALR